MPSNEDVIDAMKTVKPVLADEGAERERIDDLRELCKKWWESPDGRKSIRNAH